MKFKIGDIVRVKDSLVIGKTYYNDGTKNGDIFSYRMRNNLGKEGRIIDIVNGKYILDIDELHGYYDGMLEYATDVLATEQYTFNPDVEAVVEFVKNRFYKERYMKLIDDALDSGMYKEDPEKFQKLVDNYKIYTN